MTIIITGASSGVGLACAIRLGSENPLVLVSRSAEKLLSASGQVPSCGAVKPQLAPGCVKNPATAQAAVSAAKSLGVVTALICSAGIGKSSNTADLEVSDWQSILDTNVSGSLHFIKACLPEMIASGGGIIILVGSTAGVVGLKRNAAYSASKHALIGLAKSVAAEYGKQGICVVPVCPGFVDTPMTRKTIASISKHRQISLEDAEAVIKNQSYQERVIPVAEVAELITFIVSGKCPSLSGHEIVMSGGGL